MARLGGIFLLKNTNFRANDAFLAYTDFVFQNFFERKLDIENEEEIKKSLVDVAKISASQLTEFEAFLQNGEGRRLMEEIDHQADKEGVFGSPTWVFPSNGEIFFGQDRFDWVIKRIIRSHSSSPPRSDIVNYQLREIKRKSEEIERLASSLTSKL